MPRKRFRTPCAALFAGLVALPAAPASAQDQTAFGAADSDADSRVSPLEFEPVGLATFDAWDGNSDGKVELGEFASAVQRRWDTNNDGVLTRREYAAGMNDWFEGGAAVAPEPSAGTADESVSEDAVRTGLADLAGGDGDAYVPWRWSGQPGAGWLDRRRFGEGLFSVLDRDGDSLLSPEEFGDG